MTEDETGEPIQCPVCGDLMPDDLDVCSPACAEVEREYYAEDYS